MIENGIMKMLFGNRLIKTAALLVAADTVFGLLRAARQRSFNSSFGINGGIRKTAEIMCLTFLVLADGAVNINLVSAVPARIRRALGFEKVGAAEFFFAVFAVYEATSIVKNLTLCGLPLGGLWKWMEKFLTKYTGELGEIPEIPGVPKGKEDEDGR